MNYQPISTELRPNYDGGLMNANYLIGGVHIAKNRTIRNTKLNLLRRNLTAEISTLCFVIDDSIFYKLINNPTTETTTDSDWEAISIGGVSTFKPIGEWDSNNTSPVLSDASAAGINGNYYFVKNTPTPINISYPSLFGGVVVSLVNGDLVVSVGSKWIVVKQTSTWDSIVKPASITDYVNGIVIPHSHSTGDITGLAALLAPKYDVSNTADHTGTYISVDNKKIVEVEFLRAFFYTAAQIDSMLGLGGGSVAIALSSLLDVLIASPMDKALLEYDLATGKWKNGQSISSYIDGLNWKESVVVATTANITLSGQQTIDGIAIVSGDRVLVKAQTIQSENGIYLCSAGAWTRASDANTANELHNATVLISKGTTNGDTSWRQTTDNIILGTSSIVFVQLGAITPDASETMKGVVEKATFAQLLDGTSVGESGAFVFFTPRMSIDLFATVDLGTVASGTITLDLRYRNFMVVLTGTVTIDHTNLIDGVEYKLWVERTTNTTITWAANKWKAPLGQAPSPTNPTTNGSSPAKAVDCFSFVSSGVDGRPTIVITPDSQNI